MAEPFIGQIIQVGFNFAPRGYASCNGQLLPIAQNTALFSLLGTQYGGDGRVTFGLPDLRGRTPLHQGQGPGLSNYTIGESAGEENMNLLVRDLPAHSHTITANNNAQGNTNPTNGFLAKDASPIGVQNYSDSSDGTVMNATMLGSIGGNQPHNNMQPYLVINFCIALEGIFPSRN